MTTFSVAGLGGRGPVEGGSRGRRGSLFFFFLFGGGFFGGAAITVVAFKRQSKLSKNSQLFKNSYVPSFRRKIPAPPPLPEQALPPLPLPSLSPPPKEPPPARPLQRPRVPLLPPLQASLPQGVGASGSGVLSRVSLFVFLLYRLHLTILQRWCKTSSLPLS